jgi:transposase
LNKLSFFDAIALPWNVGGVSSSMSTDVPSSNDSSRPLRVTVNAAPGAVVVESGAACQAAVRVPVARVPVTQLLDEPSKDAPAPPPATSSSTVNIEALPDDPAVLKQMIAELLRALRTARRDQADVQQRLDALLRKLYGPRPGPVNPDQLLLFPDDDSASEAPPAPTPPASSPADDNPPSRRGQSKPHGRRRPPAHLRREEKRYELTTAERLCPECGKECEAIGAETTEQYDYKPAEVFVISHQQIKYACKCCQGHVVLAPKPPQPIDKGLPGSGLLAQIITDKYLDHLPLHRTEQRFERLGAPLPRSTMGDWMAACAKQLKPLCDLLKEHVLRSKVLHTDDTTVPVRDEKRSTHRYGRLWDYIGDAAHPGVVFDYTVTHARDGPAAFLKSFRGFLQADAYGGYDGIYTGSKGTIIEVGCWAHARNKFADAESTDPERVLAAKAWVRQLYNVEDEAKEKKLSSAERLRLRQEQSVPVLASLLDWLLAQKALVLPKSPIAGAINYVLNQWEALNVYTTDGDLDIDNNVSERTLKLIGIGRINWLFLGSDNGGKTAAILFSFTATCKLLGIDAFAYLRDVLGRLPTHPAERLEELLPHRWQAARQAMPPALPPAPAGDDADPPSS